MNINLTINGKSYSQDVEPRLLLIHFLRDIAGLTGTHMGCETSLCGACTVELNGKAIKSCTMFAVQANGAPYVGRLFNEALWVILDRDQHSGEVLGERMERHHAATRALLRRHVFSADRYLRPPGFLPAAGADRQRLPQSA